ncbi:hypothetical protein Q9L58_008110 [Maublancomyces gigas]|uniref:Uncharacterized protein n=1 Tax=Discina gigas TaxID=1032678 RepID=A0ABR3GAM1_9PEZI
MVSFQPRPPSQILNSQPVAPELCQSHLLMWKPAKCTVHMEDLAYLQWMRDRLERVGEIVIDDTYTQGPRGLIQPFVKAFEAVYRKTIQRASILATECGTEPNSLKKAMYDQLLSCCEKSPAGIESRESILSQAVQFYEANDDYLMAQKSQELYLALLSQPTASGEDRGVLSATRKLINLYEKVSEKLGFIANRLGLNVAVALTVSPVLHRAIRQNNVLLVSETLDRVDKSHDTDILGRDALHCACETRALPILQFLIRKGYHLNQDDFVMTTPLCLAAEVGFMDGVTHLVRAELSDAWNGNDINHPRWRVLRETVENGHLKLDDLRIDAAIVMSTERRRDRWGKAVAVAARGGHLDIVAWILEMGVDMNAEFTKDTIAEAICVAAAGGHLGVVRLLVEHGVGHNLDVERSFRFQAPLYHAARGGNLHIVEWLIQSGVNVNLPASNGWTALQVAAENGHVQILEELILHGADINARPTSHLGRTALQAAIGGRHLAIVRSLIERGANVNAPGGRTALAVAAENGDLELLELLIEHGAKPTHIPRAGDTRIFRDLHIWKQQDVTFFRPSSGILYVAAKGGHLEVVRRLIALGAGVSETGRYSALGAAAEQGNVEIVKLLVENEVHIDCRAPIPCGDGPRIAALRGHLEIAQYLVQNTIDINRYSRKYVGEIALLAAVRDGRLAMVESLIEMGANINPGRMSQQEPALLAALRQGYMDIVQLLVRNGADMHIALVDAARGGHLQNVIWLVENGANMASRNQSGDALDAAASRGHLDVVKFLIRRETYIEPVRAHSYRQNALLSAAGRGHLQIVKLLIAMGAPGDCLTRALDLAVRHNDLNVVKLLILCGADINANPSDTKRMPVLRIVTNPGIAQLLIDNGADVNAASVRSCSPLMFAVMTRNLKMAQLLLRHGINVVDEPQRVVEQARSSQDNCMLELLVAAGAKS